MEILIELELLPVEREPTFGIASAIHPTKSSSYSSLHYGWFYRTRGLLEVSTYDLNAMRDQGPVYIT